MKRKILSLILVFAMTVSLLTVGTGAVEPTYGDTAGHWAESSIERWSAYGIIQGSNGQFDPNGQLTCAQLATILAKLLKLPAAKDAGFTDNTADAWYYDAINRCAAAGILNGNGDGTVTPEAPITRERAMVMLARALGIEPIRKPDLTKYTDAAQVSAYAQGYVAALIEAGIVGGVTADELAPQANINRASTVTILDRAISTYADQAGATVKADGKGIVLVVAENVKITGAPEGTKIVVADGATGLTVNGKSVSDDQTYIVPKTEPAKPSGGSSSGGSYTPPHSHSYDTTTHKCSCGEFDPAVVATIGDEAGYLTLKDAVAAVEDGGTIKLIKDTTGTGIGTYTTPQTDAEGNLQISAKSFTIDFSNHTYTVNSPAVGSNGFETQGFHFEKSATTNPEIILRNGKIVAAENSGEDMAMLIMNYCSLTLTNMVIDGSNLKDAYYGTGPDRAPGPNYTLSNSSHNAAKTLIQNTEIIARSGENNVAFDSDYTSHVTVAGSSIIRGKFEVGRNASLVIIGGTFKQDVTQYCADGYEAKNNDNGTWTVREKAGASFVAQIGGVKYTTLGAAIRAADENAIVKLVKDVTEDVTVSAGKTVIIDLNGKKLVNISSDTIVVENSATLTITGTGTVDNVTHGKADIYNNGTVILNGGSYTRSLEKGVDKDNSGGNSYYNILNHGIMTIGENVSVTSSGHFSSLIANGYFNFSDTNPRSGHVSGTNQESPKLTINGGTFSGGINTIKNDDNATLIINDGSFSNVTQAVVQNNHVATINGGTFDANAYHAIENRHFDGGHNTGSVTVTSGTFTGGLYTTTGATWNITGGTFSSNPSAYVAEGYKATKDESANTWTVEKKNWDDYDADGTTMPAGVKITSRDNNGNVTVTLEDEDAFKYFTQKFDMDAACSARKTALDNGATRYPGESVHNHLNIWYRAYHQVHVEMAKSVNLGGMEVTPFTEYSTFDGKGFTISNAKVSGADTSVGFFGGNPITNVKMDSISVTANNTQYAGVISGFNSSSITNVTVTRSTVTGGKNTGAIVGNCYVDLSDCTVENCTISGQYKVGGLAGYVCREDGQKRIISNNTLRNVTLKGEKLISGKSDYVIGQAIGNWNARSGGSINVTTIENVTGADSLIGKIESDVATPSIDGKVQVGSQEALANAISSATADEETSIKLAAGAYTLPSLENKSITISGTKDTVINMKGEDGKGVVNKATSASFDGVTVAFANENYKGFQHTETLIYKDCTIKGLQFLYADNVEFNNCTFEQEDADSYHIWTYGAKNVTFTDCTFNSTSNSKAVLCYIEGAGNAFTRTFNNCTFIATGTPEKSAIMINPTANTGTNTYTVNINNCTATGYAENGIFGQTIVGVKETVKDTIIINIDGKQIYSHSTGVIS